MSRSILVGLLLAAMNSTAAADDAPRVRPITEAESVLAVFGEDCGLSSDGMPKVIQLVWPDGYFVWSKNRVYGGAPYFAGHVQPQAVKALLSRLEADGVLADKTLNDAHFGPDSLFTTVLVKSAKKQVKMRSWHEVAEDNGAVALRSGLISPNGQSRYELLRKEPTDYLHYRLVWSETRARLSELRPDDGKPTAGKLVAKPDGLSWQEPPRLPASAK